MVGIYVSYTNSYKMWIAVFNDLLCQIFKGKKLNELLFYILPVQQSLKRVFREPMKDVEKYEAFFSMIS